MSHLSSAFEPKANIVVEERAPVAARGEFGVVSEVLKDLVERVAQKEVIGEALGAVAPLDGPRDVVEVGKVVVGGGAVMEEIIGEALGAVAPLDGLGDGVVDVGETLVGGRAVMEMIGVDWNAEEGEQARLDTLRGAENEDRVPVGGVVMGAVVAEVGEGRNPLEVVVGDVDNVLMDAVQRVEVSPRRSRVASGSPKKLHILEEAAARLEAARSRARRIEPKITEEAAARLEAAKSRARRIGIKITEEAEPKADNFEEEKKKAKKLEEQVEKYKRRAKKAEQALRELQDRPAEYAKKLEDAESEIFHLMEQLIEMQGKAEIDRKELEQLREERAEAAQATSRSPTPELKTPPPSPAQSDVDEALPPLSPPPATPPTPATPPPAATPSPRATPPPAGNPPQAATPPAARTPPPPPPIAGPGKCQACSTWITKKKLNNQMKAARVRHQPYVDVMLTNQMKDMLTAAEDLACNVESYITAAQISEELLSADVYDAWSETQQFVKYLSSRLRNNSLLLGSRHTAAHRFELLKEKVRDCGIPVDRRTQQPPPIIHTASLRDGTVVVGVRQRSTRTAAAEANRRLSRG